MMVSPGKQLHRGRGSWRKPQRISGLMARPCSPRTFIPCIVYRLWKERSGAGGICAVCEVQSCGAWHACTVPARGVTGVSKLEQIALHQYRVVCMRSFQMLALKLGSPQATDGRTGDRTISFKRSNALLEVCTITHREGRPQERYRRLQRAAEEVIRPTTSHQPVNGLGERCIILSPSFARVCTNWVLGKHQADYRSWSPLESLAVCSQNTASEANIATADWAREY
jgi:hypothetical protein